MIMTLFSQLVKMPKKTLIDPFEEKKKAEYDIIIIKVFYYA